MNADANGMTRRSRGIARALIAALLSIVGCSRTDDRGAEIVREMPIMQATLATAATSGEPMISAMIINSPHPSWTRGRRTFVPASSDRDVNDELRALAIDEGWEIARVDESDGTFTTEPREIEGRWFTLRVGYIPSKGEVTLSIDQGSG